MTYDGKHERHAIVRGPLRSRDPSSKLQTPKQTPDVLDWTPLSLVLYRSWARLHGMGSAILDLQLGRLHPRQQQPKRTNLPPLLRACPLRSLRVIYRCHPSRSIAFHYTTQSQSFYKSTVFLIPTLAVHLLTSLHLHRAYPICQSTKKHTITLTNYLRHIISKQAT